MKKAKRKILVCFIVIMLLFTFVNDKNYSKATDLTGNDTLLYETLRFDNTQCGVTATEWNARTTYGWNLGNALSSVYGRWDKTTNTYNNQEKMWGQPITTIELIQFIKSLGFNSIRIPVTFYRNSYIDSNGQYHINEEWLNRVAQVVDMCLLNDLTVYLCPMCDSLPSLNSDAPIVLCQDEAKMNDVYNYCIGMWRDIATHFKGYDGRLAFESYNEVWSINSGLTVYTKSGHEQMNYINQLFVNTVRSTGGANSDRVLILSTYGHEYDFGALNDFVLPQDSVANHLIVSIHVYSAAVDQRLDSIMTQLSDFRTKINAPVIIDEWGFTAKSLYNDSSLRQKAYSNFSYYSYMYGIKSYVWDNGHIGDFGLINRYDYTQSEHNLIYAITHPQANITQNSIIITDLSDSHMNMNYRFKDDLSGIQKHPWYGFVAFGAIKHGYPIPKGSKYFEASTLKHTTDLKAIRFETVECVFYDANDNKVGNASWMSNGKLVEIPANAKYVRLVMCNRFEKCIDEIPGWFADGQIKLYIAFYE